MTQDEIIEMARESGMELYGLGKDRARFVYHLVAFTNLVAAKEREALAQTQEPVAWRAPKWSNLHGEYGYRDFDDPVTDINGKPSPYNEPLYTHPQRTWVGLTDDEITALFRPFPKYPSEWDDPDFYRLTQAIEAKLKEKNGA
jgi:hypothetical protein